MRGQKSIANRHFMLSDNFLQLVENILVENVKSENNWFYVGVPCDDIEIKEVYREQTKWSDFRILVPTLFNFFHGIELLLKAANYKANLQSNKQKHNLSNLFNDFKTNYPDACVLIGILQKYIYPSCVDTKILSRFYNQNGIRDSSKFYEVFRYPFNSNFQHEFNFKWLNNLEDEGMFFFNKIINDIRIIRKEIEML